MGQAAQVLNFFDAEHERPRRKSMARLRIDNRNTCNLPLPSGNLAPIGVSEIVVYEDEVKAVLDLVEKDEDKIRLARQAFLAAAAQEVKDAVEWLGSIEELQAVMENKSEQRIDETYKRRIDDAFDKLMRESHLSFEGKFHEIIGRGILPLKSAEVIENGLPEPQRQGMEDEKRRFIDLLREAGLGGSALTAEKLQQVIADQVAAGVAAELKRHGIITRQDEPKPAQQPPRK